MDDIQKGLNNVLDDGQVQTRNEQMGKTRR